tara:strand:- start:264 stop:686 length:423 start_codon:yes stop_codon:yes gene_type:complete
MITRKKIEETIKKIHKQNWKGYMLYFIGGVVEDRETKDIDIFVTGNGDEKELVKSINNVQERGLVDFFVVENVDEEKTGIQFDKEEKFAKTYPSFYDKSKGYKEGLYWRKFIGRDKCAPCEKENNNTNIQKPLLIYNGVI